MPTVGAAPLSETGVQRTKGQQIYVNSGVPLHPTVESMVADATVIVRGTVVSQEGRFDSSGLPSVVSGLAVDEVVKDETSTVLTTDVLSFCLLGSLMPVGSPDYVFISPEPELPTVGEEYVLMLIATGEPTAPYGLLEGARGLFQTRGETLVQVEGSETAALETSLPTLRSQVVTG